MNELSFSLNYLLIRTTDGDTIYIVSLFLLAHDDCQCLFRRVLRLFFENFQFLIDDFSGWMHLIFDDGIDASRK